MFREPSISKSISASTTGRVKRELMREIDPYYGKKGTGWIRNPEKALYNKIYRMRTIDSNKLYNQIYKAMKEKEELKAKGIVEEKKGSLLFRILKFIFWGD